MADSFDPAALEALQARYRELLARFESNRGEFARLARSVLRIQEEERRRIARELHDGIGQNLTALKHQLALLESHLDEEGRRRLAESVLLCAQTLEDTRQLSRLLRPQVLDDLGIEAALRWLARTLGESGALAIELEIGSLPVLDGETSTLVFRLAQEALTNVLRHAGARQALLRLVHKAGALQLTVWDDGRGCDAQQVLAQPGAGIGGMRERLRLYGGAFELHSQPGQGCRLRMLLPLPAAEA
jgi:signal transduction histidine kinase